MGKKLNEIQKQELIHLKDWCLSIINYFIKKNGDTPMFNEIKSIILASFDNENIKGMRMISKDINEWGKGLPHSELNELNTLLHKHFGEDLNTSKNKEFIKIKHIIKKGFIDHEDEYRLLLGFIEDIDSNNLHKEDLVKINQLLVDFERKRNAE